MKITRVLIAGSVDDGKSTLVGRLFFEAGAIPEDQLFAMEAASIYQGNANLNLALYTDGLKAERSQGITIDVAYRYFEKGEQKFRLADAPGHIEYTRNLVTAATQSDIALILVDAARGVSIQTKRHAWICQWLGLTQIAFCINKLDLTNHTESRFLQIQKEINDWMPKKENLEILFFPMSALLGDGLYSKGDLSSWYAGPSLMDWLSDQKEAINSQALPARFAVQLMIRPENATDFSYRGYAGTLEQGEVSLNTPLQLARTRQVLTLNRIEKFGETVEVGRAGEPLTLLFNESVDLSRGDLIESCTSPTRSSTHWLVEFCFVGPEAVAVHTDFLARIGTAEIKARVAAVSAELNVENLKFVETSISTLQPNGIYRASLVFQQAVNADAFGTFPSAGRMILIHGSNFQTLAAVLLRAPESNHFA